MRKPVEMLKILLVSHKSVSLQVVSLLHEMGLAQIEKIDREEILAKHDRSVFDRMVAQLMKLSDLARELGLDPVPSKGLEIHELNRAIREAEAMEDIHRKVSSLKEKKLELDSEANGLEQDISSHEFLYSIGLDPYLSASRIVNVHVLSTELKQEQVAGLKGDLKFFKSLGSSSIYIGINCKDIPVGFQKVDLKSYYYKEDIKRALEGFKAGLEETRNKIARVERDLSGLRKSESKRIINTLFILEVWKRRFDTIGIGGETVSLSLIEGWVEKPRLEELKEKLAAKFGSLVSVVVLGSSDYLENAPTKLANHEGRVKPFEFLTNMISIPRANELDPSPLIALLLPLTYGMIVGDVGYGIISFFVASYMAKKLTSDMGVSVAGIWKIGAVTAILFGILFDEWFAMSLSQLLGIAGISFNGTLLGLFGVSFVFHRLAALPLLILYTIIFGAAVLVAGLLLGIVNEWNHSKKHALAKIGWILVIVSAFLWLPHLFFNMSYLNLPIDELGIGLGMFVVALFILIYTEGITAIFEVAGLGSNVLSFARIAGVGVAGVIIGEIINEFFRPNIANPVMFVVMTVFFLVFHVMNAVLAMVEGLIQGGRLNVVEFNSKYFHGGGRLFAPFRMPEKAGEEN